MLQSEYSNFTTQNVMTKTGEWNKTQFPHATKQILIAVPTSKV